MNNAPDPDRIVREVTFAVGDGRTIEARIVPYNTDTMVSDLPEHGGTGIPYIERWLPGAFDRQANAANRVEVLLNFEHQRGIDNVVGHGIALREEPDALYGTFRVHPGPAGDKALHMVNEGILTGLSVEAVPKKSQRTSEGIVERVKATLDNVALCRLGRVAYKQSQVLAVREAPENDTEFPGSVDITATVYPDAMVTNDSPNAPFLQRDANIDELLQRVGFQPLERHTIVRTQWNGSPAVFDDESWQRACVLDRGEQFDNVKSRFAFPVLEPNGDLNVNGMHAAAQRLNQAQSSAQAKARAARRLVRYYRQAGEDPPASLVALAGRS